MLNDAVDAATSAIVVFSVVFLYLFILDEKNILGYKVKNKSNKKCCHYEKVYKFTNAISPKLGLACIYICVRVYVCLSVRVRTMCMYVNLY